MLWVAALLAEATKHERTPRVWREERDPNRPTPQAMPVVLRRPCPRCGAGVGEPCDARTLGRYPVHAARTQP